jgi:hypothetical protein
MLKELRLTRFSIPRLQTRSLTSSDFSSLTACPASSLRCTRIRPSGGSGRLRLAIKVHPSLQVTSHGKSAMGWFICSDRITGNGSGLGDRKRTREQQR